LGFRVYLGSMCKGARAGRPVARKCASRASFPNTSSVSSVIETAAGTAYVFFKKKSSSVSSVIDTAAGTAYVESQESHALVHALLQVP
jgi:hypothetical protein